MLKKYFQTHASIFSKHIGTEISNMGCENTKLCSDCKFKNECGIYACLQEGIIDDIVNCPYNEIVEFEIAKEAIVNEIKKPFIEILDWLEKLLRGRYK